MRFRCGQCEGEGQPKRRDRGALGEAPLAVKELKEAEKEPRWQVRGLRNAGKCPTKALALNIPPKQWP